MTMKYESLAIRSEKFHRWRKVWSIFMEGDINGSYRVSRIKEVDESMWSLKTHGGVSKKV